MRRSVRWFFALALVTASLPAPAQTPAPTVEVDTRAITVTLDVQPRSFTPPATLTLTWDAPSASTCVAGGAPDWSGQKPASGTQPVAGQLGATTYELTCSGPVAPVTVAWTNPTKNTDGSDYADAKAIELYRAGTASGLPNAVAVVLPPTTVRYTFSTLPVGTSHFAVKAVNLADQKSALSGSTSTDVQAQSGAAAPVTVTGTAAPPTGVVSVETTGYAVKPNPTLIDYVLDGAVGTVALGVPCDVARQMNVSGYYAVNRAKYVTWTGTRRPNTVVVQCAPPQGRTVESEAAPLEEEGNDVACVGCRRRAKKLAAYWNTVRERRAARKAARLARRCIAGVDPCAGATGGATGVAAQGVERPDDVDLRTDHK